MGSSLESSEQTGVMNFVELFLANVQHDSSQVKLLLELRNEDVDLQSSLGVFIFCLPNDVDQPLKVFLSLANPEEDQLSCLEGSVVLGSVDEILEDRSKRSHSDTGSNHHHMRTRGPGVSFRSEGSGDDDVGVFGGVGVVNLSGFSGPGSNSSDVERQQGLVGSRSDGEGVEQTVGNSRRGDLEVLSGLVVVIGRSVEGDVKDVAWKPFHLSDFEAVSKLCDGHQFVHRVQEQGTNQPGVEDGNLDELSPTVHETQRIEHEGEDLMEDEEGSEEILSEIADGEDCHSQNDESSDVTGNSSWGSEQPPPETWEIVGEPINFSEQAGQGRGGLGGNAEEVDKVTNVVKSNHHKSSEGTDDVEVVGIVEGDEVFDDRLSEQSVEVLAHGKKEHGEDKHHGRSSTTSGSNTPASNSPQSSGFSFIGIGVESFGKDGRQGQVVEGQPENLESVVGEVNHESGGFGHFASGRAEASDGVVFLQLSLGGLSVGCFGENDGGSSGEVLLSISSRCGGRGIGSDLDELENVLESFGHSLEVLEFNVCSIGQTGSFVHRLNNVGDSLVGGNILVVDFQHRFDHVGEFHLVDRATSILVIEVKHKSNLVLVVLFVEDSEQLDKFSRRNGSILVGIRIVEELSHEQGVSGERKHFGEFVQSDLFDGEFSCLLGVGEDGLQGSLEEHFQLLLSHGLGLHLGEEKLGGNDGERFGDALEQRLCEIHLGMFVLQLEEKIVFQRNLDEQQVGHIFQSLNAGDSFVKDFSENGVLLVSDGDLLLLELEEDGFNGVLVFVQFHSPVKSVVLESLVGGNNDWNFGFGGEESPLAFDREENNASADADPDDQGEDNDGDIGNTDGIVVVGHGQSAVLHIQLAQLLGLRARISHIVVEYISLNGARRDIGDSHDDIRQFGEFNGANFLIREDFVGFVGVPKSISSSNSSELFDQNCFEERSRSFRSRLQNSSDPEVNVVGVVVVKSRHSLNNFSGHVRIVQSKFLEGIHSGKSVKFSDGVVVLETGVSSSLDVDGHEVSSVSFQRTEHETSEIFSNDVVFSLRNLGSETHENFIDIRLPDGFLGVPESVAGSQTDVTFELGGNGGVLKVALSISSVNSGSNESVTISHGGTLELQSNLGINGGIPSGVRGNGVIDPSGKPSVKNNVLMLGNVPLSGSVEKLLVIPVRVLSLELSGVPVVVSEPQDSHSQEHRVFVTPGVTNLEKSPHRF